MSRIGKKPVAVPSGVSVSVNNQTVNVEGKKGSLSYTFRPEVGINWDDSEKSITVSIDEKDAENRTVRAHWGTTRALIANMIKGVTEGYARDLEVVGVGWTAAVQGQQLKLNVGLANSIMVNIPQGVQVEIEKNTLIKLSGADKQKVGQFAAEIRSKRKPEPYNGKGIKYADEVIRRKQGKAFGS